VQALNQTRCWQRPCSPQLERGEFATSYSANDGLEALIDWLLSCALFERAGTLASLGLMNHAANFDPCKAATAARILQQLRDSRERPPFAVFRLVNGAFFSGACKRGFGDFVSDLQGMR
jgi:hypothetical protein